MATRYNITKDWKKSSYSGNNGQCVEVCAPTAQAVAVRDSKDLRRPALSFLPEAWETFVADIDRGTFDTV